MPRSEYPSTMPCHDAGLRGRYIYRAIYVIRTLVSIEIEVKFNEKKSEIMKIFFQVLCTRIWGGAPVTAQMTLQPPGPQRSRGR